MNRSIAILCTSPSNGGLEISVVRMTQWMQNMGYHVLLICQTNTPIAHESQKKGFEICCIKPRMRYADFFSAWQIKKHLERKNCSLMIIHANADMNRSILAKILMRNHLKLIYTQHMQLGLKKTDWFHTWEYSYLDAWITPLKKLALELQKKTHIDPKKIFQIPHGIDLDKFIDKKPAKNVARRKLGLPLNATMLGMVGRFDRKKGQVLMLRAFQKLLHSGFEVKLLIVGENTLGVSEDYGQFLNRLCHRFNIQDHVFFRPFMLDVEIAYAAMDVFVMPSSNETYGLVTLEAMAASLPVVAIHNGGSGEIITNQLDGLLIAPGSVFELTTALKLLLKTSDLRQSLAKNARRKAIEFYSHLTQCNNTSILIDELLTST